MVVKREAKKDLETIRQSIWTESDPATFVFTGDDIAVVSGRETGFRNYIQHFEERIRWELTAGADSAGAIRRQNFVFHTGVKGTTAEELNQDFSRRVSELEPKTVFVMLGTGDAARNTEITEFKGQVKAIIGKIRAIGAVPLLQTSIRSDVAYREAMKEVAKEEAVLLVDQSATWSADVDSARILEDDGLTPNETGHLRLAKELMDLLGIGGDGFTWNLDGFSGESFKVNPLVTKKFESSVPSELVKLFSGNEPVTWLFSGDSITHGALHTHGYQSFVELFAERVKGKLAAQFPARTQDFILNTGVSGMTTQDLLAHFDRWVTVTRPDVVFIAFGMNDASNRLVPLDQFQRNFQMAVKKVRDLGAIPVLQTINTVRKADESRYRNLPEYIRAIREVAETESVLLVDHDQYWRNAEKAGTDVHGLWLNDAIHPNEIGTAQMAGVIFQTIGI